MALETGSEAITVVIEKLTEIVEGTHSNEGGSVDRSDSCSTILAQHKDNFKALSAKAEGKENKDHFSHDEISHVLVQEDNSEHQNIKLTKADLQKHLDKENDKHGSQQIIINLPAGIHSLNTADPQALLHTLMQMTSTQVVVDSSNQYGQSQNHMSYNGQYVETIGAEMVIPANSVYAGSTTAVDESQDGWKHAKDIPTEDQASALLQPLRTQALPISGKPGNEKGASNGKELLQCSKCDYCSHNKHYLKQHVDLVHNADRPFKCPFCDYAGKRSHSLKEHLVVHSTNRPFECPICNASFRKKGHLTNHIRLHNTFKYFECSICQEKFKDRSLLYSHLRESHEPSSVYECKVCEYATTIKSNIVMHMHTHGNPEVYRCNICSFTALHINILKQHMQTHSANNANLYKVEKQSVKARPVILLKCSVCGYTTDKKEALQNHMWQHLPENTTKEATTASTKDNAESQSSTSQESDPGSVYKCTECSYSCNEAYLFITHMLAHHPRQKLIAEQQKQQQQQKQQETASKEKPQEGKDAPVAFTHDSAAGMYRCTICGYMCEQQRTIKAHIWKHSGHKDIDYPMFQNGPLSVYDDTPVGKAVLLSEKSKKPPIKVIPRPVEEGNITDKKDEEQPTKSKDENMDVGKESGSVHSCIKVSNNSGSSENKGAVTDSNKAGIKKMNPYKKQAPPQVGVKLLRPVLPSQPIKWGVRQLGGEPAFVPNLVRAPGGPGVRFAAPLTVTGVFQSPQTVKLPPTTNSSEIVRLILGPGHGDNETKPEIVSSENPSKRKIVEQSDEKDAMLGVAKRLCLEEVGNNSSTGNVVVQQLSQIYTTPTITIATNHITTPQQVEIQATAAPQPPPTLIEEVDSAEGQKTEEEILSESPVIEQLEMTVGAEDETLEADTDSIMVTEVEVETGAVEEESSSTDAEEVVDIEKEEDLTLVQLLKKGPNHNPVCPSTVMDVDEHSKLLSPAAPGTDTDPSDADSENAHSEESKRKKGICSSLLAVIEQLRERSRSESEGEVKVDKSEKIKVEKLAKSGTKRKSRRGSAEDDTPIEQYPNIEKMKSNPIQYRCKLCHYSSISTGVIKIHMRLHKTKQPFECSLCEHQATSSETLQEHMLQHCKVRTYHCKVCTAVFNYKSQLRAHMRAHNEKEPFLCDLCDYETSNPIAFRNHSRVHAERKEETATATDAISGEKSVSADSGTDVQKDLVCDECDFEADSTTDLMLHIKSKHPVTYKCDQCEQQCSTWSSFSAHLKMHLEVRTLKCELCDFVATSMRSLKSHMKRHVNDQRFVQQPLEQYKCNLCGYVCHHLPSLKSHMWRHASDKNYSYTVTNDVINAAIDYDTNPAMPKTAGLTSEASAKDTPIEVVPSSRDTSTNHVTTNGPTQTTPTPVVPAVPRQVASPECRMVKQASSSVGRPCLVTFRCCQCGFESLDKSLLKDHMKTHLDIIRKTLEVNKSRLVARAMKEIGHSTEKETSDLGSDKPQNIEVEGESVGCTVENGASSEIK